MLKLSPSQLPPISEPSRDLLLTVMLAVTLLALVSLGSRWAARKESLEAQRVWRLTFRNVAAVSFLLGAGIIWREHLQSTLVILGAATAGVMLTFREAFLSLLAFWIQMVKRYYGMGDFIEIDGVRGEVLDITWQHTVLAETGPGKDSLHYSGRVSHIPNSRVLFAPLYVDNFTGDYGAHVFVIPLPREANILRAEGMLLAAAEKVCTPFYQDAREHMTNRRKSHAIDTPSVEPKSRIRFNDDGTPALVLRIVVPSREKLKVEQQIVREFLAQVDEDAWPRVVLLDKARK